MKPILLNQLSVGRTSASWWFVYLSVLLSVGIFVRDSNSPVRLAFTLADIIKGGYGLGDPIDLAKAAQDIVNTGWILRRSAWVFDLWPPGFSLLEAGIVKTFGPEVPLILVLLILSAGWCALLLVLMRKFLLQFVPARWATILPLSLFCFPVARLILLEPIGLILGEAFAIESFLLGLLLFLLSLQKRSLWLAGSAGCLLALAAYFRPQFALLLTALSAFAFLLIFWHGWKALKQPDPAARKAHLFPIWAVIALLLTAHSLTAPWRYYHWANQKTVSWVTTAGLVYRNGLMSDEKLLVGKGRFIVAGGGNLACKLEPSYCDSNDPALFKRAFFKHPFQWAWIKLSVSRNYWFAPVSKRGAVEEDTDFHFSDWLINGIFLLCALSVFPLLTLTRRSSLLPALLWVNAAVFSTYLAIFTLVHFEVRYFFFIKLYSYIQFVILACILLNINQAKKSPS